MSNTLKPFTMLEDVISGRLVPNVGAEENRQALARYLMERKGYHREDIEVDVPIVMDIAGEPYRSALDLVVGVGGRRMVAFRCVAGSIGSYEREILAAARLLNDYQIPWAASSDGKDAVVLDTVSGRRVGAGLDAIPGRAELEAQLPALEFKALPPDRRLREQLIFRTYDRDGVNRGRHLAGGGCPSAG
jgi:hypothetical protein